MGVDHNKLVFWQLHLFSTVTIENELRNFSTIPEIALVKNGTRPNSKFLYKTDRIRTWVNLYILKCIAGIF